MMSQVGARLEQVLRSDSVEVREKEKVVAKLRDQIREKSKERVIEEAAYIWFNRFCALRFMDVNRYTFIGIVSPAAGRTQPEILFQAKQGVFDEYLNVDKKRVVELINNVAASTNPQQEAYRLLLKAACSAYYRQLPFLFADIEDYTELLMPEDLLSQNSILQQIRDVLTEETCQDVEVIGWLYQFYISEKKDEVMARKSAVPSEDIPAVTQLFTPHWIVRYLVENSLGRLWMLNHPDSKVVERMEYYIKSSPPEGQSPEHVEGEGQEYIKISSPEEIKICDPACGSGHMLTYAFDLLSAIYEEQGYDAVKIPGLILKHNLFGVEIDERAGQLAAFALMMKAREKDADFFGRGIEPNICVMENISFSEGEIKVYMDKVGGDLFTQDLWFGLQQFEDAKTFGSLIRPQIKNPGFIREKLKARGIFEDLFLYETNSKVQKSLMMAEYLSQRYHVVVTNPPYFGKGMNLDYKNFAKDFYPKSKSDTFAMFIERNCDLAILNGYLGFMTPFVWMFITSFENLRLFLIKNKTITSLIQLEYSGFEGATVPICTFTLINHRDVNYSGAYIRLSEFKGADNQEPRTKEAISNPDCGWFYLASAQDFRKIPGAPIAYWLRHNVFSFFEKKAPLNSQIDFQIGMVTGNNQSYVRNWYEVSVEKIGFKISSRNEALNSNKKWFPYAKGGEFRKWSGNKLEVVNWEEDGKLLRTTLDPSGNRIWAHNFNLDKIFKPSISWNAITSSTNSFRYFEEGFLFDSAGGLGQPKKSVNIYSILGYLNSYVAKYLIPIINPTLNLPPGYLGVLPCIERNNQLLVEKLVHISEKDWNFSEISWDFGHPRILDYSDEGKKIEIAFSLLHEEFQAMISETKELEEQNNEMFITAFELEDEIDPKVPKEDISLLCNPFYRYSGIKDLKKPIQRIISDNLKELISYSMGCLFGRYSLDKDGIILANLGEGIDNYLRLCPKPSFMPNKDNIIPVLDGEWFDDDISERTKEFLMVTFGEDNFSENLKFLENSIGRDLRDYFLRDFYDEHVKMYKKRPIYWMFSSPNGTFNALIYMHRYTPDTVSIVLNSYLRPFIEKLTAYKNHQNQIAVKSDSDQRQKTKAEKEIASVDRMLNELKEYEEEVLFPLAAQKIEIDLDDGVLVNYRKFGKALKYVKGLSD